MSEQQGLSEKIAKGLQSRDESALLLFIGTYGRMIRQAIGRKYGEFVDDEELDSALNLAMGVVWSKIDEYDPVRGTLEGWAYGIAEKIARHGLRFNVFEVPEDVVFMEDGHYSEEDAEVVQRLLSFIDEKLAPRERKIIRADLAAGGKADDSRLADEFCTTKGSIQSTRSQARRRIKQARGTILAEGESTNER